MPLDSGRTPSHVDDCVSAALKAVGRLRGLRPAATSVDDGYTTSGARAGPSDNHAELHGSKLLRGSGSGSEAKRSARERESQSLGT